MYVSFHRCKDHGSLGRISFSRGKERRQIPDRHIHGICPLDQLGKEETLLLKEFPHPCDGRDQILIYDGFGLPAGFHLFFYFIHDPGLASVYHAVIDRSAGFLRSGLPARIRASRLCSRGGCSGRVLYSRSSGGPGNGPYPFYIDLIRFFLCQQQIRSVCRIHQLLLSRVGDGHGKSCRDRHGQKCRIDIDPFGEPEGNVGKTAYGGKPQDVMTVPDRIQCIPSRHRIRSHCRDQRIHAEILHGESFLQRDLHQSIHICTSFLNRSRKSLVRNRKKDAHGSVFLRQSEERPGLRRFERNGIDKRPSGIDPEGRFDYIYMTGIDTERKGNQLGHFMDGPQHHFLLIDPV